MERFQMRNLTLRTLVGTPAILVAAFKTGRLKPTSLLGVTKSDFGDDQFEATYIDDVKLTDKFEFDIPEMEKPNHMIGLRDADDTVVGYFLIEDVRLPIADANAIADILVEAYDPNTGKVRGAKDETIYMPAKVDSDRARVRLLDGRYVNVDISQFGTDVKLTASLLPGDTDNPTMLLIGAEGDEVIYAKPVLEVLAEARNGRIENVGERIEIEDGKLKRIGRAKDGEIKVDTDKGNYQTKYDDGELKITKLAAREPTDDVMASWDDVGDSEAMRDEGGNPVQAWVRSTDRGVRLAFAPNRAVNAPEVQV